MSTLIIRNKNPGGLLKLSEDARRRGREYLKSVGIDLNKCPPLMWPDDAVSAYQETMYSPWQFTTKSDIRAAKIERMNTNLKWKRRRKGPEIRYLYVWVFHCPGISGFFEGWYTYLVGLPGPDVDLLFDGRICKRLMQLFPVYQSSLFDEEDSFRGKRQPPQLWMKRFAKKYQRGKWAGRLQGKALILAEVERGWVTRILHKVDWRK